MAKKKGKRLNPSAKGTANRQSRRPVTLPGVTWDLGAAGPANRAGLTIEPAGDIDPETGEVVNPNRILRARRVDMLEVWHKRGTISTAGYNFAVKLRDAFEATERAPGWPDNDRVQSSPKPDHAIAIQADRLTAYHAVARFVAREDWPVIDHFVLARREGSTIRPGHAWREALATLGPALDRAAAAMERQSPPAGNGRRG